MKIASIQLNIVWEDKQRNFERVNEFAIQAKKDGCELIVFPEMFSSGFSMNADSIAEDAGTETTQFLSELANKNQINIIAGFVEKNSDLNENVAVYVNRQGSIKARYVKNYPFTKAGEDRFYASGNEQVVFDFADHSAGLFICYDLRFPELFRKVAKRAEIVFVIANWPVTRQMHWEALLKARAIENQCYVVGVNRIGQDGNGLEYGGGSHVYSPSGEDLSRGDKNQEYIVTEIDLSLVNKLRKEFPFLDDMKID